MEHDSEKPGPGTGTGTNAGAGDRYRTTGPVYFEHERLDVARVAREFQILAERLNSPRVSSNLRRQFDTAVMSIRSNIAEGAGRTARADKQRFYEMARGSTTEAATHLDILHIKRLITDAEFQQGRNLLARVAMMLTRMSGRPRKT
ncbi:MAG: four helix bundle protein [Myxococcaceae bacterium]|nr:four helix bundle protein [Myxococcaceae bacterium]